MSNLVQKVLAEFIGTTWLVFCGCGSAVFAAYFIGGDPKVNLGIGFLGVALAFGLSVMGMAYAIGHISGCHLNPAVSIGLLVGGRFGVGELIPYIIAQVAGAIAGATLLFVIASGSATAAAGGGLDTGGVGGFASNGYGDWEEAKKERSSDSKPSGGFSPGGYSLPACFAAEVVFTFFFLMIILGSTDERAPKGLAPIAIGLGLTSILLGGIPVTNLSVNPARSTGTALYAGADAVKQLWMFWVAPIVGAALAGVVYRVIGGSGKA